MSQGQGKHRFRIENRSTGDATNYATPAKACHWLVFNHDLVHTPAACLISHLLLQFIEHLRILLNLLVRIAFRRVERIIPRKALRMRSTLLRRFSVYRRFLGKQSALASDALTESKVRSAYSWQPSEVVVLLLAGLYATSARDEDVFV
jgi:hypothetical protein